MKKPLAIVLILLSLLTAACGGADSIAATSVKTQIPLEKALDVNWTCTSPDAPWQTRDVLELAPGAAAHADIRIDTSSLGQEVSGFGGAFNEKGWVALSVLPPGERDAVIKALFDPEQGARFNICRVPIGASDYSVSRYTLNETVADYEMKHFSIDRDRENLIPYIKAAMRFRSDLQVWGSAWTPPTWMKTSGAFDGGSMKDDPKVYQAYALYLARFVEAYRAEGIDLFAVAVQNEPGIERNYPTCLWTPEQFKTFIRDYMGPLFTERQVDASIMLGTHEEGDFGRFPRLLEDPAVSQYVSMTGFQWGGVESVSLMRKYFPGKQIYQTETECGNFYWKEGYDPNRPQNDWDYGVYTWNKIKEYFDRGINAYMLWNMVLDEEGKSIDAVSPWPQNAAITVDKSTKQVTYTPMFYAFKHFSYYVAPGARYVSTGSSENAVAFLNPDGSLVIQLQNPDETSRTVSINVDGGTLTADLPAMSWSTLVIPG